MQTSDDIVSFICQNYLKKDEQPELPIIIGEASLIDIKGLPVRYEEDHYGCSATWLKCSRPSGSAAVTLDSGETRPTKG